MRIDVRNWQAQKADFGISGIWANLDKVRVSDEKSTHHGIMTSLSHFIN